AALEQLLEEQSRVVLDQSRKLQQSVREAESRAAELKRAQEESEQRRRILHSILQSMGHGVAVADEKGQFLVFNAAARDILGAGPDADSREQWPESYGLSLPDQVTMSPAAALPLARAMRGETVEAAEIFVRKPGVPQGVWLSVNARPLVDDDGQLRG